jgi:hypothetical protein
MTIFEPFELCERVRRVLPPASRRLEHCATAAVVRENLAAKKGWIKVLKLRFDHKVVPSKTIAATESLTSYRVLPVNETVNLISSGLNAFTAFDTIIHLKSASKMSSPVSSFSSRFMCMLTIQSLCSERKYRSHSKLQHAIIKMAILHD